MLWVLFNCSKLYVVVTLLVHAYCYFIPMCMGVTNRKYETFANCLIIIIIIIFIIIIHAFIACTTSVMILIRGTGSHYVGGQCGKGVDGLCKLVSCCLNYC